jgi:hypothetical protein
MPDITMCDGGGCTIKDFCYRHMAKASERQSFFIEPPYKKKMDGTDCKYYTKYELIEVR